jgi:hypothetical protein
MFLVSLRRLEGELGVIGGDCLVCIWHTGECVVVIRGEMKWRTRLVKFVALHR